jgi:hypothetical protein
MQTTRSSILVALGLALLTATSACGTPDDGSDDDGGLPLPGLSQGGATSEGTTGDSASETDGGDDEDDNETNDGDSSGGGQLKLDVGPDATTGGVCPPDDACCNVEIPPHELLDAFLLAYPAANMPKSVQAIRDFVPQADGHVMAKTEKNVGDEIIDPNNGGVIEANIETGRAVSRGHAELAIPAGSVVIDEREDPVTIEVLGGSGVCTGMGWGWGSLLVEDLDGSISELVYLYIGYCVSPGDGDIEVFYFSMQSMKICEPPA